MYFPSAGRINPSVSAEDTEGGVMSTTASSGTAVRSPANSLIAGLKVVTLAPLQFVMLILTGSTCLFFSLFVTGWLVIGGKNSPVPTPTVVLADPAPPSLSVTFTETTFPQPALPKVW